MTAGTLDLGRPAAALRARTLVRGIRLEFFWFVLLLAVVGLAHGINMFDYPFYENDEGTYMSQAWALVHMGELAPYTYWYDHAPFGWIQVAAWTLLTGGFYSFGNSVESGRVLMLLYELGSAALVYLIVRRATNSVLAATVAILTFGLSAYGLYFHRRVLLDNIATFWALLSLYLILAGRLSLWRTWASALCLALGVLSKEVVVFLVPALAYLTWYRSHVSQRLLAISGWLVVAGSVISLYILMAILKGELFPTGTWLGGTNEHVSLLGSVSYQASRGADDGLLNPNGDFWNWARDWARIDPLLVVGGTAAAVVNLLLARRNRTAAVISLMTISMWAFLARGGLVIEFYLVPLLPFLALSLALAMHGVTTWVRGAMTARATRIGVNWIVRPLVAVTVLSGILWGYTVNSALGMSSTPFVMWTSPQADAQRLAIDWTRRNLSSTDAVVIDAYNWTDLHDAPAGLTSFDLAHWYWKIDFDPDIRDDVFAGRWENLDYVMLTPQMQRDVGAEPRLALVGSALEHSTPIASWDADGWEIAVRRVDKVRSIPASSDSVLTTMWAGYRQAFVDGGRVTDPSTGRTTSEGQAYAMLQAVYMDDRTTFDAVWTWTRESLQQRTGLFAWLYGAQPGGSSGILDGGAATDADQDIALALLFASKRWEAPDYERSAAPIIDAIWRDLTAVVNDQRYVVAGQWAAAADAPVINPSYLAPYAYRIFGDVDVDHDWEAVVDSSYDVLEAIAASPELGGAIGAPPNWVSIDRSSGVIGPALEMGDYGQRFSFDASRVPWRLAVDWMWFRDDRAEDLLTRFDLPRRELERTGRVAAEYHLDGSVFADYESISMYAGVLPGLLLGGAEEAAYDVLARKIIAPLVADDSQVGYYDSNWAWFSTALVDGGISNLWVGSDRYIWIDRVRSAPGDRVSD